jgi:hypothetical protein
LQKKENRSKGISGKEITYISHHDSELGCSEILKEVSEKLEAKSYGASRLARKAGVISQRVFPQLEFSIQSKVLWS